LREWETESQYLGDYCKFKPSDPALVEAFAMHRFSCPANQHTFDPSGVGKGVGDEDEENSTTDGKRNLRGKSLLRAT
jgi:hypothetical protein